MTQQSAITNERLEFRLGSFHSTELLKNESVSFKTGEPCKNLVDFCTDGKFQGHNNQSGD